jgi:hypothetical protein
LGLIFLWQIVKSQMARKSGSGKVYSVVKGADGKFKSVSRAGKSSKAPAVRRTKAAAAPKSKGKRTATAKQLASLVKARAARTHAKLERMYGPGGGLPVGGPSGGDSAIGSAVSNLVKPGYGAMATAANASNPYAAVPRGDPSTYAVAPKNTDY